MAYPNPYPQTLKPITQPFWLRQILARLTLLVLAPLLLSHLFSLHMALLSLAKHSGFSQMSQPLFLPVLFIFLK